MNDIYGDQCDLEPDPVREVEVLIRWAESNLDKGNLNGALTAIITAEELLRAAGAIDLRAGFRVVPPT